MNVPKAAARTAELPIDVAEATIDEEAREVIEHVMQVARERLEMEIAWLAEFRAGRKVFRVVEGETDEWGLHAGDSIPLAQSYCRRMFDGVIPNAIRDTDEEAEVATLDVTRSLRIGSYIGVPLVLPDGELRGAFCCARHGPHPHLDERDVRFIEVLARLVGDELAYRSTLRIARRLEREAASATALAAALAARDNYTGEHSDAVVELAAAVGRRLGLGSDRLRNLEQVARLHDIGKVGVPDTILQKPGALDDDEWELMRRHPQIGAGLVAAVADLAHLAPAIAAEHEQWDGRGYPRGLAGDDIPVESRVTLVCDSYHAMISDRPYRAALSTDEAVDELLRCSGTMFWPAAVDALLEEAGLAPAR